MNKACDRADEEQRVKDGAQLVHMTSSGQLGIKSPVSQMLYFAVQKNIRRNIQAWGNVHNLKDSPFCKHEWMKGVGGWVGE